MKQIQCPSCGYTLDAQAPVCGNCGTDMRGYQVGPFKMPGATSGIPKGFIVLIALIAVGAGGFFLFGADIEEAVQSIERAFEPPEVGSDGGVIEERPRAEWRITRVRQLTTEINAGGLRCRSVQVDHEDEFISTGSCQAGNVHVQINVYLFEASLEGAGEILKETPFATVNDENWWIVTQPQTARAIHRILGGKLRIP
jgi:hypothetical protein